MVEEPPKEPAQDEGSVQESTRDREPGSRGVEGKDADEQRRQAGKQPGAKGFGRQQKLPVSAYEEQRALWRGFGRRCAKGLDRLRYGRHGKGGRKFAGFTPHQHAAQLLRNFLCVRSCDANRAVSRRRGCHTTAYWIASRSSELMTNLLGQDYSGWLMSDGYGVYRGFPNRLRCWAHLIRKARGVPESLDPQARPFGMQTLALFRDLMTAVEQARGSPPGIPLTETWRGQLADYHARCEQMKTVQHKPTRDFAHEMLNDWDAIFRVLQHPELPLTNNEAERALRHWVILRKFPSVREQKTVRASWPS